MQSFQIVKFIQQKGSSTGYGYIKYTIMWKIFKKSQKLKIREHYMKLRLDAIEAQKKGDRKKYIVLNAIADRMIDQVIFF